MDYGIILCTHEAFTRIRHESFETEKITRRSQVSVIFDEARKCTMDVKTLNLPIDIAQELFHKHLQITDGGISRRRRVSEDSNLPEDTLYRPLNVINGDTAALNEMFTKNKKLRRTYAELVSMLDSASGAATKLYASITLKGQHGNSSAYAIVHTLLVPYKLFYGWKDVVLLSAFFENSQMYHLLKAHDIGQEEQRSDETAVEYRKRLKKLITSTTPVRMIDITNLVVDPARVKAVKARYRNTSITYLSHDTSFSKRHLTQGMMVSPKAYIQFHSTFAAKYKELEGPANLRLIMQLANKEEGSFKPSASVRGILAELKKMKGAVTKYTPLQWYARASVYISQQWYAKQIELGNSYEIKPLPITCNAGTNKEYLNEIADVLPVDSWTAMPFQSHGLNTFKSYDTLAFLATLNPKPEVVSIMSQLCPDYEPRLDYTIDQCVQSSTRCSIRDTRSTSKPLIIVTDETLARAIVKHLCDLPTLIDPIEFGIKPKIPVCLTNDVKRVNSEEAKQARREYNAKPENVKRRAENLKKLRETEAHKVRTRWMLDNSKYLRRIGAVRVAITRARKSNDIATLKKLEAEALQLKDAYNAEKPALKIAFSKLVNKI
jgi:hypothetical protein